MNLDDTLDELPTGTRDELCISALSQALGDIEKLELEEPRLHPDDDEQLRNARQGKKNASAWTRRWA